MPKFKMCIFNNTITFLVKFLKECHILKSSSINSNFFAYLFNNLFKVDKFTKMQYTYIHKRSQASWLINVNYPILQIKNLVFL